MTDKILMLIAKQQLEHMSLTAALVVQPEEVSILLQSSENEFIELQKSFDAVQSLHSTQNHDPIQDPASASVGKLCKTAQSEQMTSQYSLDQALSVSGLQNS
jgi:hypothetical protein